MNLKYLVVLCDGMADFKIAELNNKTPMTVANKPMMNKLVSKAQIIGTAKTIPDGFPAGSDVANLSVMGYDPKKYYTGRSPLEAFSMGVDLNDDDIAIRCNLVTLSDDESYKDKTLIDYCADDISTEEAGVLIDFIEENLGTTEFKFYKGISYRHCLVWNGGLISDKVLIAPHDIINKNVGSYTANPDYSKLYDLMEKSFDLLKNHPINTERVKRGKKPANSIWLWGEGTKPKLDSFYDKFNLKGSVVSAVDLIKGIGTGAKMKVEDIKGVTGYIDTDFDAKLNAAVNNFESGCDFVYVHVEAPDECGHRNELHNKIRSIELIDEKILTPMVEYLEKYDDYKIMVLPDHPTPISIRTHSREPVPFFIYRRRGEVQNKLTCFDEEQAAASGIFYDDASILINVLTGDG